MTDFFALNYTGGPFVFGAPPHLAALGIVALICLLLAVFRKRFTPDGRKAFRYGAAALLVVNELAWHAWRIATGTWTAQEMLPLHICSVMVWFGAYMLIKRSYFIYEFLYFMGIAAASQALLTPDAGIYGFPHFRFFQTFTSHGFILISAIYMTVVEGFRPTALSMVKVFVGMNLYMIPVTILNFLIGSNYLFTAHVPETPSLIDHLGPWPWYILSMELIGLALCLLLYLPFWIKDLRAKAKPSAA